jgi:PAS domain S-box-containing protein
MTSQSKKHRVATLKRRTKAIDQAPVGISISDPGRADNPLIYVNDAFVETTGYPREEINGENCRFLQGEHTDPDTVAQIRDAIDAGEPLSVDLRNYRKDGTEFWNHLEIAPVTNDAGEIINWVGYQQDITERKQKEQELGRQNERLEQFASVVSHDLRNPLTVAQGRLELARDECDSDYLDDMAGAHERMDALIENLLTLAQTGSQLNETEAIDFVTGIENCWRTVETEDATLVSEADLTIRADPSRLRQLLENLFHNAVEHGGEEVTITVGELDDRKGFYVSDNGCGIPETERDDVFEAGYSTIDGGTGFGLNIVEEITDAHGWEITVSENGQGGARFEITGVEFPGQ